VEEMRAERERELLHHGKCSGVFEPRATETDYFLFICTKCNAVSEIKAVIIDDQGRIIFNLYCPKCRSFDVLKTHPQIGSRESGATLSKFHLSSRLGLRIGTWRDGGDD
jgi:hypothetical protein